MTTAKLNATTNRWMSELSEFNFHIKYRPRKVNVDADFLSRMPINNEEYIPKCTKQFNQMYFQQLSLHVIVLVIMNLPG